MNTMTRSEAINAAGIKAVEAVESKNCEFTNGVSETGFQQFSATVKIYDDNSDETGDELAMYYYISDDDLEQAGDELGDCDWAGCDKEYEII